MSQDVPGKCFFLYGLSEGSQAVAGLFWWLGDFPGLCGGSQVVCGLSCTDWLVEVNLEGWLVSHSFRCACRCCTHWCPDVFCAVRSHDHMMMMCVWGYQFYKFIYQGTHKLKWLPEWKFKFLQSDFLKICSFVTNLHISMSLYDGY